MVGNIDYNLIQYNMRNMIRPQQLINVDSEEGQEFIRRINTLKTKLFGDVHLGDNLRKYKRLDGKTKIKLPNYFLHFCQTLTDIIFKDVDENIKKVLNDWSFTVGIYGRKKGTTIKQEQTMMRIILNLGEPEIYHFNVDGAEQSFILGHGWAVILPPQIIPKTNVTVSGSHIRPITESIGRIRGRNYLRTTIVMDLRAPKLGPKMNPK